MNRAATAAVALIGLTGLAGCAFLTRLPGPPGPSGPHLGGPPPARAHGAIVLAGGGALTHRVNDSYVAYGSFGVSRKESTVAIPVPAAGTLSNFEVLVAAAPGTGASWTFTVDKNKSATLLSCPVAGVATSCGDSSLVAMVAGDKLDLRVSPFGAPAAATINWSATLTP